jgi:hypothetical protein
MKMYICGVFDKPPLVSVIRHNMLKTSTHQPVVAAQDL